MPLVRTTFEPDKEVFVSDAEYLDLLRQGLIYSGPPLPTPTPADLKSRPTAIASTSDYRLTFEETTP